MNKAPSRKGFYDEKEDLPDYKPNYECVQRRVDYLIPRYELMTGRKPFAKKLATNNEDLYDYDQYTKSQTSHVYPKSFYTDLNKMLPKELNPESGLPSFLQKTRPVTAASKLTYNG